MMDSCQTPTILEPMQFTFNAVATPNSNGANQKNEGTNLIVNRSVKARCFTPTTNEEFRSPGLSPIPDENGEVVESKGALEKNNNALIDNNNPKENFVKPTAYMSKNNKNNNKTNNNNSNSKANTSNSSINELTTANLQQQQKQYQNGGGGSYCFDDTSSSYDGNSLNFSTSTKVDGEGGSNSIINISQSISELSSTNNNNNNNNNNNTSSILNHTLNVTVLLQQAGLGKHAEKFSKQNIDLGNFSNMTKEDLKKIGVESDEECQAILNMLAELNAA